jgi:hypothetical protein
MYVWARDLTSHFRPLVVLVWYHHTTVPAGENPEAISDLSLLPSIIIYIRTFPLATTLYHAATQRQMISIHEDREEEDMSMPFGDGKGSTDYSRDSFFTHYFYQSLGGRSATTCTQESLI